MVVGAERNESLVEGGQQGIKMNFGAELADSNLTLIYANAAGCKFTRKFIPDWSREDGRLPCPLQPSFRMLLTSP